ncbi:MAG: caspase domain-containing protein [Bacteroidota bacterium]
MMNLIKPLLLCAVSFLTILTTPLSAQTTESRVALVIGIKNYQFVSPLQNTLNDAKDMASTLKSKGFEVVELYDPLSKRQMQDAIVRYFELLQKNNNAVGVVFYSGHGMQVDGANYLIPTAANMKIKADIEDQCLNMDYVMRAIEQAGNKLNIFILDACRNNPFKGFYRSGEQGLNMVSTPKGSYIVYATKPGAVASDGTGRNGLFTSNLLKHMNAEGLNIEQVFKRVASDVSTQSGDAQRPWIASDYTGDFFFSPGSAVAAQAIPMAANAQIIFEENFTDNTNKWLVSGDQRYDFRLINGKYRMESKAGGQWFSTKPVALNTNLDFEISATIRKTGGTDGFYFGILMGMDPATGFSHFAGVTGWGNAMMSNRGPVVRDFIGGSNYNAVARGNNTNVILVKKTGSQFKLFINGQLIGEAPVEEFFGNYFGFQLWSGNESLSIEADDLKIRSFMKN